MSKCSTWSAAVIALCFALFAQAIQAQTIQVIGDQILSIVGTSANEDVELVGGVDQGDIWVQTSFGSGFQLFEDVKHIHIVLYGGNDLISVKGISIPGNSILSTGVGFDTIDIEPSPITGRGCEFGGDVGMGSFVWQQGSLNLTIMDTTIGGDSWIRGAPHNDTIKTFRTNFLGVLEVDTVKGLDSITFDEGTNFYDDLYINSGKGNDKRCIQRRKGIFRISREY